MLILLRGMRLNKFQLDSDSSLVGKGGCFEMALSLVIALYAAVVRFHAPMIFKQRKSVLPKHKGKGWLAGWLGQSV